MNDQKTLQTLDYSLDEVLPAHAGSRDISSVDIVRIVAPTGYWDISPARLVVIARWTLLNWTNRPPEWVSDGVDFCAQLDLFSLLTLALVYAADAAGMPLRTETLPTTQAMPVTYSRLRQIGCIRTCSGTAWSF